MISFFSETDFEFSETDLYQKWIVACMEIEGKKVGDVNIIFCDDAYLLAINQEHLDHDYYTDIITFDYSDLEIEGDIFISVERVAENAKDFETTFKNELSRVIIHGFLHMAGYGDKTPEDEKLMRKKENECLALLNSYE